MLLSTCFLLICHDTSWLWSHCLCNSNTCCFPLVFYSYVMTHHGRGLTVYVIVIHAAFHLFFTHMSWCTSWSWSHCLCNSNICCFPLVFYSYVMTRHGRGLTVYVIVIHAAFHLFFPHISCHDASWSWSHCLCNICCFPLVFYSYVMTTSWSWALTVYVIVIHAAFPLVFSSYVMTHHGRGLTVYVIYVAFPLVFSSYVMMRHGRGLTVYVIYASFPLVLYSYIMSWCVMVVVSLSM